MARDLKKFVNPSFIKTMDIALMHRLLMRYAAEIAIDLTTIAIDVPSARAKLAEFFKGDHYPECLVEDLHRIAALGNENGLRILLDQASRLGVDLIPASEADNDNARLHPKHVALRAFLDHPAVFERAADGLALQTPVAPSEFVGIGEGVVPYLTEAARAAFEAQARDLFARELMGRYCRIGWYDDGDDINIVVTRGTPVVCTPIVKEDDEGIVSYRGIRHDVLSYTVATGRLKIGGSYPRHRQKLADIFSRTMLRRPGFFDHADRHRLYTLEPIVQAGYGFLLDHSWDPGIRLCAITEMQVDDAGHDDDRWSITVTDRWNAIARMGACLKGQSLSMGRINFIKIALIFDVNGKKRRVTVKLKPPGIASFRRTMFEGRVLEFLWRNGFCIERSVHDSADDDIAAAPVEGLA